MPKYRLWVEFEAEDLDYAWGEARAYCDWGGEPSIENMKAENMHVEQVAEPLWVNGGSGSIDYEKATYEVLGNHQEPTIEFINNVHKCMVEKGCVSISMPTKMFGQFIKTLTGN